MSDLFSQENFIWTLPLAAFTLLIILITCYFLRREIANFFKKLFFPDTQRYTVPASVISNVDMDGKQTASKKDNTSALPNKKRHTFLRNIETNIRWIFRKLKHKLTNTFAEIAGTEDAPSKQNTGIITKQDNRALQQPQSTSLQPTSLNTQDNTAKQGNISSFIPEDIKEEYPEVSSSSNAVIMKQTALNNQQPATACAEQDKYGLQKPAAIIDDKITEIPFDKNKQPLEVNTIQKQISPEQQNKKPDTQNLIAAATAQKHSPAQKEETDKQKPSFISDRTALITGLLILVCFTIFLTAKVRLLGSLAMRNYVLIKDLQTQIQIMRYEQEGVKVIIHERTSAPEKKI